MRPFLKRTAANRSALLPAIFCACSLGILLFTSRLGDPLAWLSFDVPFRFAPGRQPTEAIVVTMDETAFADRDLNPEYEYPNFNRATHARFLEKLKADGAPVVVFDIFFKYSQPEDSIFAAAITNHGNVILAAQLERLGPEFGHFFRTNDPADAFLDLPGCKIAFAEVPEDSAVRTFPPEFEYHPSIPLAASAAYGVSVERFPHTPRWVAYYGDRETLPTQPYQDAMGRPQGYFKDKVVFIGGKPKVKFVGEIPDEFNTTFSRWSGQKTRGVEIHATMFLNLIRNEWLTQVSRPNQLLLIILTGVIFGWSFTLFRPLPGLVIVFVTAIGITVAAIALFWTKRIWFNWALIGWVEIPIAWATSALIYSRKLDREKESLQKELESIKSARPWPATVVSPASALADLHPVTRKDAPISIRDFELLKEIGEGAYGQVWLARSLVGAYRAIKIVFRKNFSEQRPFEREFEGVRNFEAISRDHPGWVSILHIGKDESAGFFYYVMEPADDLLRGPNIDPSLYAPKTLGKLLVEKEFLPVAECVDLGIDLAAALAALHGHRLVHRDVKPSNIIFANNKPKLADIGLVANLDGPKSIVGTEGFIPPEGPGGPLADIFSLGRVLYQAATGCPPDRHPELPTSLGARGDARELMRLMEIINKACARLEQDRYASAGQLHDDLIKLRTRLFDARA